MIFKFFDILQRMTPGVIEMKRHKKNKYLYVFLAVSMSCFFLVSCSFRNGTDNVNAANNAANGTEQPEMDVLPAKDGQENGIHDQDTVIVTYADLTHDGVNEKIAVDVSSVEETQEAILKVLNDDGRVIWQESAGIPHVGWNSVYLCTVDGKDYLLRYNPYMNQGWGSYSYILFSIDAEGNEKIIDEDDVLFDITGQTDEFDIEKLVSFHNKINGYLDKSILLLSTEQGEVEYSTEDKKITRKEEFFWLYGVDTEYDENDLLEDKLRKYRQNIN